MLRIFTQRHLIAIACTLLLWSEGQENAGANEPLAQSLVSTSNDLGAFDPEAPVPRFKKQAIQGASLSGGWMGATDGSDLSSQFWEASIQTGIPLGSFDNILGVTPAFRVDFIDAAPGIDVPSELYETGLQLFYLRTLSERWKIMSILRPAIRSDFTTGDNALRIFGLGLMIWDWVPNRLSLSFGAVYLGRADLPPLPALGLVWTPRTNTRFELQFPRSRVAYRLAKNGAASESWLYSTISLGGNTWAVTRASGQTDELSLRDFRLTVGVERIVSGGGGWFAEAGYAFDRSIEYEASETEVPLSDGIILQGGWSY